MTLTREDRTLEEAWLRARKYFCDDFEIGIPGTQPDQKVLAAVQGALALVRRHDPKRFAELRSAMPRILISGAPGSVARFSRTLRLCELRGEYLKHPATAVESVALTLVHEGVHARVTARGLHNRGLGRVREERLAFYGEIAFARRLPNGDRWVEQARRRFAAMGDDYSEVARRQTALLGVINAGAPRWLVRVLAWYSRVDLDKVLSFDPYTELPAWARGGAPSARRRWLIWAGGALSLGLLAIVSSRLPGWLLTAIAIIAGLAALVILRRRPRRL